MSSKPRPTVAAAADDLADLIGLPLARAQADVRDAACRSLDATASDTARAACHAALAACCPVIDAEMSGNDLRCLLDFGRQPLPAALAGAPALIAAVRQATGLFAPWENDGDLR